MTTEERLAKVERELAEAKAQATRVKRRSRWLLAALGLGLGALALVWASAASVSKAEAQGVRGEVRYQISAISPGVSNSSFLAFALDGTTGQVYALMEKSDADDMDARVAKGSPVARFVWRALAEGPQR